MWSRISSKFALKHGNSVEKYTKKYDRMYRWVWSESTSNALCYCCCSSMLDQFSKNASFHYVSFLSIKCHSDDNNDEEYLHTNIDYYSNCCARCGLGDGNKGLQLNFIDHFARQRTFIHVQKTQRNRF